MSALDGWVLEISNNEYRNLLLTISPGKSWCYKFKEHSSTKSLQAMLFQTKGAEIQFYNTAVSDDKCSENGLQNFQNNMCEKNKKRKS